MDFTIEEYMKPIREFLLSYPDLQPLSSSENGLNDSLVIEYLKTTPQNVLSPEGYAVANVGTNIINRRKNVLGKEIIREQANFYFLIKKFTQINQQRKELGDFILNFRKWINYENSRRNRPDRNPLLPHFSMTEYEQIQAVGGMEIGTNVDPQEGTIDIFQLQINIIWETIYN